MPKISERRLKELDERQDLFIHATNIEKHEKVNLQVQLQIA